MTNELLQQANRLRHAITALESQIHIVEDMHHCDNSMNLGVVTIGAITIAWDDELKDDIIDLILNKLNAKLKELEDEFARL